MLHEDSSESHLTKEKDRDSEQTRVSIHNWLKPHEKDKNFITIVVLDCEQNPYFLRKQVGHEHLKELMVVADKMTASRILSIAWPHVLNIPKYEYQVQIYWESMCNILLILFLWENVV